MSDSRYQHGKRRLDPHLHLYGERRLEPCTSPRNKFWSFYYTGTIRPTSTAGHVKKTVFGLIAWWAAVCGVACSCSGEKDFAVIFDHLVVLVVTGMILVIIKPIAMVYNHVRLSLLQGICGWIHTHSLHTPYATTSNQFCLLSLYGNYIFSTSTTART